MKYFAIALALALSLTAAAAPKQGAVVRPEHGG